MKIESEELINDLIERTRQNMSLAEKLLLEPAPTLTGEKILKHGVHWNASNT